jgi:hypothetical protein
MPWSYTIDTTAGLVRSTCTSTLTAPELLAHMTQVRADPAFTPAFHHLVDARAVDRCDVDGHDLRHLATRNPWGPDARCAVVVGSDVGYGVGRMYEIFSEQAGHTVQVFRELDEALRWLGVEGGAAAAGRGY